jgi:hypothetical protein
MEINFHGRYDKKLFFISVFIANQPSRRKPWVLPVITAIVLLAFILLAIRLIETRDVIGNASYIVIVMIAGSFVARSFLLPFWAARKLWTNPAVHEEHQGIISSKGIIYRLKIGQNDIPWSRFSRVRRVLNVTALVTRDGLLIIFPNWFFRSESDWKRFNQLVDSNILSIK